MALDRRTLLDQRDKAMRMAQMSQLPQDVRDLAKQAADHAEVSLGLQAALAKKQLTPATPENQPASPAAETQTIHRPDGGGHP